MGLFIASSDNYLIPFISLLIIAVIIVYYYFVVSKKPQVYTGDANLACFLNRHISVLGRKYFPSMLCWEGRLQTFFVSSKRSVNYKISYERVLLSMKDGGKVGLDILDKDPVTGGKLESEFMVIILPGMISSSQSAYVKTMVESIVGFCKVPVAVLNSRGWGGVALENSKTICGTDYADFEEAVSYIKTTFPERKIIAVGASIGGLMLMNYLLNNPQESKQNLLACITISTPLNPWGVHRNLTGPINIKLNHQLVIGLQSVVLRNRTHFENHEILDINKILKCKTGGEWDTHYSAPQYGHKSMEDYYDTANVTEKVDKFEVPVVALNSDDDPLQLKKELPILKASQSRNFALVLTSKGGHLGFLEGFGSKKVHFGEKFVAQVIRALALHSEELKTKSE